MRGFTGSGKSTKAKEIALETQGVVVSRDAIRKMLGVSKLRWGELIYDRSSNERGNAEYAVVRVCKQLIRRFLELGFTVISDAQHVVNAEVREEIAIADEIGVDVKIVDCDVDLNTLLKRNETRPADEYINPQYIRDRYHGYRRSAFRPIEDLKRTPQNLMEKMRDNHNVRIRKVDGESDLYACNFTRTAFFNHAWDEYSSKARGLFLNHEGKVIMRGFDKFFNVGENLETSMENVLKQVEYPARIETKQNGFLGIIGAKEQKDEFRFYSKSGQTPYSALVERQFRRVIHDDAHTLHAIWSILRERNVTLVCEIIDVDSDRHIISYDGSTCFFIHAIKNQQEFALDYEADDLLRKAVDDDALFTHVEEVHDEKELEQAITKARGSLREGIVVYGANGYMCKVKSDRYLHLKSLRHGLKAVVVGGKDEPEGDDQKSKEIRSIIKHADLEKLVYTRQEFGEKDVDIVYAGKVLDANPVA
jgi:predicted kinase